jgi:hypothetical protein
VLATAYLDEAERTSWVLALDVGRTLAAGAPERISESVPGTIVTTATRPEGDASRRAWRRGATWRVWSPERAPDGHRVRPDLNDAVTVAALGRELATPRAGGEAA